MEAGKLPIPASTTTEARLPSRQTEWTPKAWAHVVTRFLTEGTKAIETRTARVRDLVLFCETMGEVSFEDLRGSQGRLTPPDVAEQRRAETARRLVAILGPYLASEPEDRLAIAEAWRDHMHQNGLAPASINRRLATLRAFVTCAIKCFPRLIREELTVENFKVRTYRDTRGPGVDGFAAMWSALKNRTDEKGARDRAILALAAVLGLRSNSIRSLNMEDVDRAAGTLSVKLKARGDEKGLKTFASVPLLEDALLEWIRVRGPKPGPLFTSMQPRIREKMARISKSGLYDVVAYQLGKKAGVRTRPHGLRHTAITTKLETNNGDIADAMRFSDHSDPRVLMRYQDNAQDKGRAVDVGLAMRAACDV